MENLPFDESDDAGPTRVLSPQTQGTNDDSGASSNAAPSISATRPRRTAIPDTQLASAYSPADAEPDESGLPDYKITPHPGEEEQRSPQETGHATRIDPGASESKKIQPRGGKYDRIQFLPGALGWLVAYALVNITFPLHSWCLNALGLNNFSTFQEAFASIVHPHGSVPQTSLWVWIISTALLYTVSFAVGGYAAARMTVRAPFKQGLGLWLWQLFATMLTTAVVGATGSSSEATAQLALQQLLGTHVNDYLPGVVVLFFLSFVGSVTGSLFGPLYHRHLNSPQDKSI